MSHVRGYVNEYAIFLQRAGEQVFCIDGVDWYLYQGFLMPAYLPHATPEIDKCVARRAIKVAGVPFARWNQGFDQGTEMAWWYVIRKGLYSLEQCSRSTRSKIRRGLKKLVVRPVSWTEMEAQGYSVCKAAMSRYHSTGALLSPEKFHERLKAARDYDHIIEYIGVFCDDELVAFSENHLQDGGVFWENIWYHPDYLGMYSSYVLTHYMLEYYLNDRNLLYVSDGCRSIYHQTGVQDFLMERFGFERAFAKLEVVYSPGFLAIVSLVYPFYRLLDQVHLDGAPFLDKGRAILFQERIRRNAC